MTSPSDDLRPVIFTRGREEVQLSLRYDPVANAVVMDPVPLEKLNLSDFKRIHGFFRKIQGLRYNLLQERAQSQVSGVPRDDVSHTVGGEYFRRDR